jgi:hypothetical protein
MSVFNKQFMVLLLAGVAFSGFAQMSIKFKGSNGWGLGSPYEQAYSNYSLKTITGTITKLDTVSPMRDMVYGIQMIVKTSSEDVVVHLGPAWFILYQDMNLSINSKVEVRGCNTSINSKNVMMAANVKSNSRILYLRDEDGKPYWCAWRKE